MSETIRVRLTMPHSIKVGDRRETKQPGDVLEVSERTYKAFHDRMVVLPSAAAVRALTEVEGASPEGSVQEGDSAKHPGDDSGGTLPEAGGSGGVQEGGTQSQPEAPAPQVTVPPPWQQGGEAKQQTAKKKDKK